jgi:hypothetical protein
VASIWGQRHVAAEVFARVFSMGNVSREGLNGACWDAAVAAPSDPAQCLFAAHALPFVATRTFLLNSFQDEYQAMTFLAPALGSLDAPGGLVESAAFAPCTKSPQAGCNASQYAQWRAMGSELQGFMLQSLGAPSSAAHGGFLHSCATHGSCILGRCSSVRLAGSSSSRGLTAMRALRSWWLREQAPHVHVDAGWPPASAWPAVQQPNPSCPAPY